MLADEIFERCFGTRTVEDVMSECPPGAEPTDYARAMVMAAEASGRLTPRQRGRNIQALLTFLTTPIADGEQLPADDIPPDEPTIAEPEERTQPAVPDYRLPDGTKLNVHQLRDTDYMWCDITGALGFRTRASGRISWTLPAAYVVSAGVIKASLTDDPEQLRDAAAEMSVGVEHLSQIIDRFLADLKPNQIALLGAVARRMPDVTGEVVMTTEAPTEGPPESTSEPDPQPTDGVTPSVGEDDGPPESTSEPDPQPTDGVTPSVGEDDGPPEVPERGPQAKAAPKGKKGRPKKKG